MYIYEPFEVYLILFVYLPPDCDSSVMSAIHLFGYSTMKPSCRILGSCRNSSFFGYPPAKYHHNIAGNSSKFRIHFDPNIHYLLGFRRIINETQKVFGLPSSHVYQSRVSSRFFGLCTTRSGASLGARVAPKVRNFSTSLHTSGNDNKSEKIYIQDGKDVKPAVKEIADEDNSVVVQEESSVEVVREDVNVRISKGANAFEVVSSKSGGEETEMEKEAWKLLQNAVVNYCGSPVGTLAANDPGDKQPLNYDQVFIRDFVPSALAFLLKGEKEIVKNFLIHNLQLQVNSDVI